MERRVFLNTCLAACGLLAGGALLGGCKSLPSVTATFAAGKLSVPLASFGENKALIVRYDKLQAPIYLVKQSEEKYSAVLMLCTHKGCELNAAGGYLICPCHGSEFEGSGKVLSPPADKDLQSYKVTTDSANIYIQL